MANTSSKNLPSHESITTIEVNRVVCRRIKNLGNYENEQLEAEAFVSPGQNPTVIAGVLRAWVKEQLDTPVQVENKSTPW